jgi:hypothetical protein
MMMRGDVTLEHGQDRDEGGRWEVGLGTRSFFSVSCARARARARGWVAVGGYIPPPPKKKKKKKTDQNVMREGIDGIRRLLFVVRFRVVRHACCAFLFLDVGRWALDVGRGRGPWALGPITVGTGNVDTHALSLSPFFLREGKVNNSKRRPRCR